MNDNEIAVSGDSVARALRPSVERFVKCVGLAAGASIAPHVRERLIEGFLENVVADLEKASRNG